LYCDVEHRAGYREGHFFSDKAEVDKFMHEGEVHFSQAEFDKAADSYTKALQLDPKLYSAALSLEIVISVLKQMDKAGAWFAEAIQINPDAETAYRYWGDALYNSGKVKEARMKFIEGFITDPIRPQPSGFSPLCKARGIVLSIPISHSPNSVKVMRKMAIRSH